MERFILQLKALQLARIDVSLKGSTFVPLTVPDASQTRPAAHLGSRTATTLDKVPRYGEPPAVETRELILVANRELKERGWETIREDNRGSLAGAQKILRVVPFARAVPLLEAAVRQFNPSATGGEPLRSLGHPFITRYVTNEFRRTERDLAQGQLTLLFVERTGPPQHVFGSKALPASNEVEVLPHSDEPPASAEAIAQGRAEFERMAASHERPARG